MNDGTVAAFDASPVLGIAAIGVVLAVVVFAWFWRRNRGRGPRARLHALALLTLFLSFDLVMLGAYTRLSDSGLGCPDWPGCYGHVTPIGARAPIAAAQTAIPTGAVTATKAWIEMAHRYSATAIGVLVIGLVALALVPASRAAGVSARAAIATLVWIVVQGAFGAFTVSMSLYPAIVTLHLLGGLGLLALLTVQTEIYAPQRIELPSRLRTALIVVASLVLLQAALGGWVSTNYAVLACRDFPTCQGRWWPDMDFAAGFVVARPLGRTGDGGWLPFQALTAIHVAHRIGAAVVVTALLAFAWALRRHGADARRHALAIVALVAWQAASGVANVVFAWPLASALAHTAGSAAFTIVLVRLLVRARSARVPSDSRAPAAVRPRLAS